MFSDAPVDGSGRREAVRDVNRALGAIEGTASSDDGFIDATAGPNGDLRSLRLDPRIYRVHDADALARDIVDTVRAAADTARREAFDVLKPLLPGNATVDGADLAFDPVLHHLDRRLEAGR